MRLDRPARIEPINVWRHHVNQDEITGGAREPRASIRRRRERCVQRARLVRSRDKQPRIARHVVDDQHGAEHRAGPPATARTNGARTEEEISMPRIGRTSAGTSRRQLTPTRQFPVTHVPVEHPLGGLDVSECDPGWNAGPSALWVTQQARQLTWTLADRPESFRFLIRDRDQQFTGGIDDVFRGTSTPWRRDQFSAPYSLAGV